MQCLKRYCLCRRWETAQKNICRIVFLLEIREVILMLREMRVPDWGDMMEIYKQSLEKGDVTDC